MEKIIISRTPLRVSFAGGGTDIRECYSRIGGAVVSAAIDRYVHIIVTRKFDSKIRASYSKTEIVSTPDELQHPIIREALKLLDIRGSVEIVSISDIPSEGTGLGSSSTFTVGLLNALHAWKGETVSARQLAEEACSIERGILKEPGGKQDQYIAAFGGLRLIEFMPDEETRVHYVMMPSEARREFEESMMLLYTGITRRSSDVLKHQIMGMEGRIEHYSRMRELAYSMHRALESGNIQEAGRVLDSAWRLKRTLDDGISSSVIDEMYERAIGAGAYGGKITGAGGGGFLFFLASPGKKDAIRRQLPGLMEERIRIDTQGSRIVYIGD